MVGGDHNNVFIFIQIWLCFNYIYIFLPTLFLSMLNKSLFRPLNDNYFTSFFKL